MFEIQMFKRHIATRSPLKCAKKSAVKWKTEASVQASAADSAMVPPKVKQLDWHRP